MICLAGMPAPDVPMLLVTSLVLLVATAAAVALGYKPMTVIAARRSRLYADVLRGKLLMDIEPRSAMILTVVGMVLLALPLQALLGITGTAIALIAGWFMPLLLMRQLRRRRLARLESQLVGGIQTLASGVRAGLNLVQAMVLVARDGAVPLRQEFAHLVREYEFGVDLDEAMNNAANRIGSGDFRLLFAALQTHRQRGGDLAETLDRISDSIREIQRLEMRVKTLTAQPRVTARWLSAMPLVVGVILYLLVNADDVKMLFTDGIGQVILAAIVLLNLLGFLWIRRIADVDI